MEHSVRPRGVRLLLPCLLALLLVLTAAALFAGPAAAAPSNTISLDDLRTAIGAAPDGVPAYFKTVLKGATISDVDCKILAVVDGANDDGSPLIMFQITDPTVLSLGGLAEGMSGSPLYVTDGDRLAGAASYGYYLTTNGLGLATPIELMAAMESKYFSEAGSSLTSGVSSALTGPTSAPLRLLPQPVVPRTRVQALARPVRVDGRRISRLVIARSAKAAVSVRPATGSAVVVPLAMVEVGGLPKTSQAFKSLSNHLERRGINVVYAGGGAGSSDFSAPIVPGASLAAVLATGDYWMAGVGTATYVDGDVVVAFGHPLDYDGACGYAMANANVYGVWSDLDVPFKMVSLGAIRGLVTQDRLYGIAGTIADDVATEVPMVDIKATATVGADSLSTTTSMPQWVADSDDWGPWIVSDACYSPVWRVTDTWMYPGYMKTHVEVTAADESGTTYPIVHHNVFDDTWDVGEYGTWEASDIIDELLWNPDGVSAATIRSPIVFDATLSPAHQVLQVLDFSIPGGLHTGYNTVHCIVRAYGETTTREVDTVLAVPRKLPTLGSVDVYGSGSWYSDYYDDYSSSGFSDASRAMRRGRTPTSVEPPWTLPDTVDELNSWESNDNLDVDFYPWIDDPYELPTDANGDPIDWIESQTRMTDAGHDWYAGGWVHKRSPSLWLHTTPRKPIAGQRVVLRGDLSAYDAKGTTVAIYVGRAKKPAVVPVRMSYGEGLFVLPLGRLTKTTQVKVVWDGSDRYIGRTMRHKIKVFPRK